MKAWGSVVLLWLGVGFYGAGGQQLRTRQIPHTQGELHERVMVLYDFHPAKLSDDERKAKSKEMDIFWDELKAQPEVTVPLLRAELENSSDPAFFEFDGSELLLTLAKTKENELVVADVLPRVDLSDVLSSSYFHVTHDLACDGIDVTAAALHTLDRMSFGLFVPRHSLTLDRRTSLMYLLLSMPEELWVNAAVKRLSVEKDPEAKIALIFALFYGQTDETDAELKRIAADSSQPEQVRKQAQEFLAEEAKLAKSWMPMKGTVPEIREQRRQRLKAVSDEAMDDVEWMTRKIVQLRAKGKG